MEYLGCAALIISWGFLVGALRCVIVWSYRFLLSPLQDYPGPMVAKVTNLYDAFRALQMHSHVSTYYDHQEYGDVVRCAPDKLVFNTIEAFQDIYQNERLVKARNYLEMRIAGHDNIFSTTSKKVHSQKRKAVARALSEKSMREFEPSMLQHIDTLVEQLERSTKKDHATDMTAHFSWFGFDVVSDLGFGESLNLLTDPSNRWIVNWMNTFGLRNYVCYNAPSIRWIGFDIPYIIRKVVRGNRFVKMIRNLTSRRLNSGDRGREDLLAIMTDKKDPTSKAATTKKFVDEALFFLPAGGGTISTALSALFFYLMRYPDCQQRLTEEIRSTFKSSEDVRSGPALSSCKYLRACLDEAMRLSPPVPGTLWRELSATDRKPLVINGHSIPKGTIVGVNIYSLHHNEKYFSDPFVFKPERWLSSQKSDAKLAHASFVPFSSGSRACAGKAMAYMEASLVVCKVFLSLEVERASGNHADMGGGWAHLGKIRGKRDEFQLYDGFNASHEGPYLRLNRRGAADNADERSDYYGEGGGFLNTLFPLYRYDKK